MPLKVAAALTALVLGLTPGAGVSANDAERPFLTLAATAPLTVSGRGFGAGEVVRLVAATAGARGVRTAITSSKGLLRIRFELRVARCAELTVRATGSLGSRAVLHRGSLCKEPSRRGHEGRGSRTRRSGRGGARAIAARPPRP